MKRSKLLTESQARYRREKLITHKVKPKPTIPTIDKGSDKLTESINYLNNCIYWITEYKGGNTDKDKALKAANEIKNHGENIKNILLEISPSFQPEQ